jgi:hypothetical protein
MNDAIDRAIVETYVAVAAALECESEYSGAPAIRGFGNALSVSTVIFVVLAVVTFGFLASGTANRHRSQLQLHGSDVAAATTPKKMSPVPEPPASRLH